jgi:hypothetical protein
MNFGVDLRACGTISGFRWCPPPQCRMSNE